MRVALFGTYNRGHSANRIAMAAVKAAGYELVEFHEPLWEKTRDKGQGYFRGASLLRLFAAWVGAAWRLGRSWRRSQGAGVVVVGFNGQLDVLLLRLLAPRYGPRLVFAPLVSLTETLVDDRRVYEPASPAARLLRFLDRLTCRLSDVVVVDTEEHRRYFVRELGVDPSRLLVCHLGADPDPFLLPPVAPPRAGAAEPSEVLYFGQYLPLHGLDVVVDAVARLADRKDLRFTFIGTGPERERVERNLRATRASVSFEDWVAYEELPARIRRADIVLGIFGSSTKATMVIPNKVYEAAALGAAIVTADTPALREVFADGEDVALCAADGKALAAAVASLAADAALRRRLGDAARARMLASFSPAALGRSWKVAIDGPHALDREGPARVGVAVLCFQDPGRALACLHSVAGDGYENLDVVAIDNGSTPENRRALVEGIEGRLDAEPICLDRNLGYAGANDLALATLFGRGCQYVLLLNSDTIVAPGTVAALVAAARRLPHAGPLGPLVSAGRPGAAVLSRGERYGARWLWAPRSLVRVRARRQRPYPAGGVLGCALFVPRALYETVGGFDERLFAYYEEVDLCLRARRAGFQPTVVPAAEVGHEGSRGFAGGMTTVAAYLKARNLRAVASAHLGAGGRLVFLAGYALLVAASSAAYLARGRLDIARALLAGAAAGAALGPPPAHLFAASGYPASGLEPNPPKEAAP